MEAYIRQLNAYQTHVEEKYSLLLQEYQTLLLGSSVKPGEIDEVMSREQEETYMGMLRVKDEEINLLHQDKLKKEQIIASLQVKAQQKASDQVEQLASQMQQVRQQYMNELAVKDQSIKQLETKIKKVKQKRQQ